MYLKRIEAIGFKSFADRTELEFVPGVTAVVGPNGSGKSNISDAIRWVLGEQSAKSLRGSKMEDVIFAGSDGRKAVNFCEVSLTLDNSNRELDLDYNEVTVTRRVYRSGDSEYMINKQTCRLKDISELFMDTGLGKEAYSIIGQGRIDEILSNKSEDRRGIFEEAAGIVKYKSRKKEAEKKLDETTANLIRIADVIGELDASMEPMGFQAEVAKEARELRQQLERYEVALYVHDIEDLHQRWKEGSGEGEKLSADHLDRSAQVNLQEADYEKLRWELAQIEQSIEAAQKALVEVVQEHEKSEGRRKLLQERQQNLQASHTDLDSVLEKLTREHQQHTAMRVEEQSKADALHAHIESLKRDLEEKLNLAKGFLDRAEREGEVESLKSDLIEKLNDSASKRNELKNLESALEILERRIARQVEEERDFTQRVTQLRVALDEANKQRGEEGVQEAEVTDMLQSLRQKVDAETRDQEKRSGILRQWQTDQTSHRSRLELLRDMESQYGGYQVGVRNVLQAATRGNVQGVHGAVAELMQVPREYELAMETALGGAMQSVVVRDEKAARDAIHFLKSSGGGRATFLPLDVIKGRPLGKSERMAIQGHSGFVGIGSELVKSDAQYQNIVDNLLGSVVVARAIADANALARLLQYRVRIVTLDGDVVNPGGSMSGGSVQKKGTSLLGRTREIEEMEDKLKAMNTKIADAQSVYEQKEAQLVQAKDEIRRLSERSEQQRGSMYSYDAQIRELTAQLRGVEERLELVTLELGQYRLEEQDNRSKQDQVRNSLVVLESETISLQRLVDELQSVLREQQTVAADVNEEVTAFKVKLAGVEQEQASVMNNVLRLQARLAELAEEIEERERERQGLTQRLEETAQELLAAESLYANFEEHRKEAETKLDLHREAKLGLASRMRQMEAQLREARLQLKNLEQLVHHNEVKVNRLDVELNNSLTKLAEEYHISFELAKERYPMPEELAITKRKVQEFRREIERLGDVNYGAIEEYARMQERHAYLTEQRNDLTTAVEQLYEVIREIEDEMSKRFNETFYAIREQFSDVFVALFGGGRADLTLTDPEKPLTTGIDVVAQPPGKKLQNLQLLSGGERALAALALLFAILRIKPVPFCVLDEVEAALDDANVARYSMYLRDFSKQTQFIVVTHRKGTMEGADVLYGITMQESGVSKVVSVRLVDQAMELAT
ncbi:chromosome segregation protein SMC [Tumebacillus permanentifrigoris]|uniref:Chromosome partition protein Smc n=1 Tax=Tumebacillus permanentifrigoris TaxID=378543 RepID=A0A316DUM1_9BACL|nr:chromosome segregation protein SMC [Tumebacillus permanentifrigoris]PWK12762.1 condensin subunit Smc [Tumebacillus permanentifrigoris]